MEKGEDERCESVKKRIGELDELEGNREFCRMRPWIGYEDSMQIAWQFPRVLGFAHHCKKFLKDTETQEKMADRNMKGWHCKYSNTGILELMVNLCSLKPLLGDLSFLHRSQLQITQIGQRFSHWLYLDFLSLYTLQ
jgi:hypothetical protein